MKSKRERALEIAIALIEARRQVVLLEGQFNALVPDGEETLLQTAVGVSVIAKVREAIASGESDGIPAATVIDKVGAPGKTVRTSIARLEKRGEVEKVGRGVYRLKRVS